MIEAIATLVIAAITGSGVLLNRLHNRHNDLTRRISCVELHLAEKYVPRSEILQSYHQIENRMERIEDKLDKLIL